MRRQQTAPGTGGLLEQPPTTRPIDRLVRGAQQIQAFKNWQTCLKIRKDSGRVDGSLIRVQFRDGFQMLVRDGTHDIFVLWEVFLAGGYSSVERLIRGAGGPCCVIDLGAHIGAFTLRCARVPVDVEIHSYEPGPDNARMLRENLALHPALAAKVRVFPEAAAGSTGESGYLLDSDNPGGSHLCVLGEGVTVPTRSFREILGRCSSPIALLKIDIEGGEYALLDGTEESDWAGIPAIMAELHADPSGRANPAAWLDRMAGYGFRHQVREFSTLLLTRDRV